MSWFDDLFGFPESSGERVREGLAYDGESIRSLENGRSFRCGAFSTPSLDELQSRRGPVLVESFSLGEVVGDVRSLHADRENAGSLFQAASQFNCLEMVGPEVTPEAGVGHYESDATQGPACAISCGAGAVERNYFTPLAGGVGQSSTRQIDNLADLGARLGNRSGRLWTMRNGYALVSDRGLEQLSQILSTATTAELRELRGLIRVGHQSRTEVTLPGAGHLVSQVYCSALPVAYGGGHPDDWEPFARLVLEASYEATLLLALEEKRSGGSGKLFLTLLGGGVFGNRSEWILDAIEAAIDRVEPHGLTIEIVSHGSSNLAVRRMIRDLGFR